mgnify:FL=1
MGESKVCPKCRMTFRLAVRYEAHVGQCEKAFAPVRVERNDES